MTISQTDFMFNFTPALFLMKKYLHVNRHRQIPCEEGLRNYESQICNSNRDYFLVQTLIKMY